jgi:hypothetical protein
MVFVLCCVVFCADARACLKLVMVVNGQWSRSQVDFKWSGVVQVKKGERCVAIWQMASKFGSMLYDSSRASAIYIERRTQPSSRRPPAKYASPPRLRAVRCENAAVRPWSSSWHLVWHISGTYICAGCEK